MWDDDLEITENLALRDGAGIGRIWFSPTTADYLPLKSTLQWIEWHLWEDRPLGYHVLNLALHIASAFLLWRLLRLLRAAWAKDKPSSGSREDAGFEWLAGLLFVAHPVAVESVAWISELKNTLSLPCLLLSLCAYIRFDLRGRRADYIVALVWFVAGLLCKSSVVILPVMVMLYSWWRHARITVKDVRAGAPFFGAAIIFGFVAVWFQYHRALAGESFDESGWARVAVAGRALGFYLCKCVFPVGLTPVYPRWHFPSPLVWQSWPWLLIVLAGCWLWTKRRGWGRHALFGLACFGVSLAPVLGLVPMSYLKISWVADHFAYIALATIAVLAAASLCAWHRCITGGSNHRPRSRIVGFRLCIAAIVAALALSTRVYSRVFIDQESLWSFTVQRNPASHVAHGNLANALVAAGRIDEAIVHYRTAVQNKSDYFDGHYNLAGVLLKAGRPAEAAVPAAAAAKLRPDDPAARFNLGLTLLFLDRLDEATAEFRAVAALKPDSPEAHYFVGHALLRQGRPHEAAPYYQTALRLRPDYAAAEAEFATIDSAP